MLWRFTWQLFIIAELTCILKLSAKWLAGKYMAELRKCRIAMLFGKSKAKTRRSGPAGFAVLGLGLGKVFYVFEKERMMFVPDVSRSVLIVMC